MISVAADNYIDSNGNDKIKNSENVEQEENLIKLQKKNNIMTDGDHKRAKFLPDEQKAIIDLYDRYSNENIKKYARIRKYV
jgi:hypothetical protein